MSCQDTIDRHSGAVPDEPVDDFASALHLSMCDRPDAQARALRLQVRES